jgi:tetratricopeptide (TPR) repeat protein
MGKRFPASVTTASVPGRFLYIRGEYDSTEAFWRSKLNDPNPLLKMSAAGNLSNLVMLRGRLKEAMQYAGQFRAINAARGVPPNPLSDSLASAVIAIWFLGQNERGVHALDAALAQVPLKSLPIEQRPYPSFISYYALAGRTDKARAMLTQYENDVKGTPLERITAPGRHAALAVILMFEKRSLDAVKELWAADSLPDGPSSDCAHCLDFDLGRAYDLANMPDSTIAHWERYLAEPFNRGLGTDAAALAGVYKRLGELYEAKGDLAKAESHYTKFVELWKSADPELQPKVAEVTKRLAAIRARKSG